MQTENEELLAYYKFKAQRMNDVFNYKRYNQHDLLYLLSESKYIREMLVVLARQQWIEYVPFIHKSTSLYLVNNPGRNQKVIAQSENIIKMMLKMKEMTEILNGMIVFYNAQIEDLKMLIALENE